MGPIPREGGTSDAEQDEPITQSHPVGFVATLTTMWQGAQSMTNERQAEIADEVIKAVPHDAVLRGVLQAGVRRRGRAQRPHRRHQTQR